MGRSVRGAISPVEEVGRLVRGFMVRSHRHVEGTRTAIGSWVRGTISPSRGGDEDGDLTDAISNSLCLRVCEAFLFLSLHVSGNDLKVKQKLKIFSGSKGLFYSQSK